MATMMLDYKPQKLGAYYVPMNRETGEYLSKDGSDTLMDVDILKFATRDNCMAWKCGDRHPLLVAR
jgi:hypothetical protein